ncbi:MAG TPA: T9SS type A sorting domain-containing protein [Bacteroidales bacterium]|nr:T9SS type A sorting domain-containing protein [Bacteroidales bacterium]
MKKIIFAFTFVLFVIIGNAGDTLKVMHYNLLYYGKNYYECDNNTNSIDEKNESLKTIIQHVQPDIFSVNELDGEGWSPVSDDATYLLENALNVEGVTKYRRTEFPEIFLANTLFYNHEKLTLKKHYPISFYYSGSHKIFNVYQFYFRAEDLAQTNDTAFVTCIVAHLKAGSGYYDDSPDQRDFETRIIMNYLKNNEEPGNILLLGDLNVYSPTEKAFQNLINPDYPRYAFNDPAGQIGEWSGNAEYRYYHTQSTHTRGDCFSTGGMDDRFDFIMASDDIMGGGKKMQYIDGSYNTIGQDGSFFNQAMNISTNTSVPAEVALALYNMSDHLPVYLELEVDQTAVSLDVSNISFAPENPGSNHDVFVFADLTDKNDTVHELKINYGFSSGNYIHLETMYPNQYSYMGTIPKYEEGTEIFFQVAGYNNLHQQIIASQEYHYNVSAATAIDYFSTKNNLMSLINPVKGNLQLITHNILKQKALIELISSSGEICYKESAYLSENNTYEFHINHLKNGLYILKITGEKGLMFTEKVVIQK